MQLMNNKWHWTFCRQNSKSCQIVVFVTTCTFAKSVDIEGSSCAVSTVLSNRDDIQVAEVLFC